MAEFITKFHNGRDLYSLEDRLYSRDHDKLLEAFKNFITSANTTKTVLTKNPSLTIYSPANTANLKSRKSALLLIHELSRTGAPVVTLDAAKTLIKNGYFVTIITMRRGPLLKEILESGIPVILDRELALSYDNTELMTSGGPLHIDTFIKAFNHAIVITAVYYNLIRRYSRLKKPILWWLHEGSATYNIFSSKMPQILNPYIHVYTGGEYALDQLKEYNLPYNPKILNYGVEDSYRPNDNISSHSDDITRFILPGSIGDRKGQKLLLEAIKALPKECKKKSTFFFIGDISSEADINGKKIKNQIISAARKNSNIKYLPSVSRNELFDIYQQIDVLVLPSLDDPMPVVATEALMLKKIVLCSDTVGTSYYIKDTANGFTFKSSDIIDLQNHIKYIIQHKKDLPDIGTKGRKIYERHFTMKVFEKNLLRAIEEAK